MNNLYTEPTADQCSNNEIISGREGYTAFACWYPQMGGYVGKAIVEFINDTGDGDQVVNYCFDAYVWHDGEFPFKGCDEPNGPSHIHHCCPSQFVLFGNKVLEKQKNRIMPKDQL